MTTSEQAPGVPECVQWNQEFLQGQGGGSEADRDPDPWFHLSFRPCDHQMELANDN